MARLLPDTVMNFVWAYNKNAVKIRWEMVPVDFWLMFLHILYANVIRDAGIAH